MTSFLSSTTISNTLSVVIPAARARIFAPCITTPSAVGSEKGIPISIKSAPFFTISSIAAFVVATSGSPQVIKGINAFLFFNASYILFM